MFHSNHFLKYSFLFHLLYYILNCQLTIPLTYFPFYKYNSSTPSTIMTYIVNQRLYANIDIGTPRNTIQIPIVFNSNDFYIGNDPLKSFPENRFTDLKFYNSNSTTLEEVIDDGTGEYYSYNGELFEAGTYNRDNFYFNNQIYGIEFYLPFSYREVNSGGIGLQLYPADNLHDSTPDIRRTFFEKLKKKKLINNYFWTVFYNSKENKKEGEATLLLGCLPEEFDGDLGYYKKGAFLWENRKTVNLEKKSVPIENLFKMDEIYAYEGVDNSKLIDDFPNGYNDYIKVELDYHSGGVKVPTKLKEYYHRVFEVYFSSENCFNDTFNKNTFYYCKKNEEVLSKIKNVFPRIIFRSFDLTYNFTLDYNDLFMEENNYVFCLLYFSSTTDSIWRLGKPFLKKYHFTFNYNEKFISFYLNTDNTDDDKNNGNSGQNGGDKNGGISYVALVIIIIGTIILVLIICFLVFKFYLYDKFFRKKRANELDDNDFDYTSKEDNKLGI